MMVQVHRSPAFDSYDIWFAFNDQIARTFSVAHFVEREIGPARLEWKECEPELVQEPTLRLTGREVADLKRALDEYGPTTADGVTLARDAIKVRDRLLTLVERLTANAS